MEAKPAAAQRLNASRYGRKRKINPPMRLRDETPNTTEHTLCSILGLSDEVADYLRSLNPECRGHQTERQWIEDFLDSKGKGLTNEHTTEEQLCILAFTPAKARALASHLARSQYSGHQTTLQWAQDHVDSQFKYNILLAGKPNFGFTKPFNRTGNYNDEFEIPTDEEDDAVFVKAEDTFMLEVGELPEVPWLTDYTTRQKDTRQKDSLKGTKFWFHGTDHDSAIDIIRSGIKFKKARPTDFSDEGGFYLSNSYQMAHEWAMTRNPKTSAVLVFELHNNNDSDLFACQDGMEFAEDDARWKKLVKYFRGGSEVQQSTPRVERRQYEDLKYVFGPMAGKVGGLRWRPKAKRPIKFQLCIKDKALVRRVFNDGRNLAKVFFFHDISRE